MTATSRAYRADRRRDSTPIDTRPYIWRLTSLSFVIWPSVWPLDHGDAIGEGGDQAGTGPLEPGVQLGKGPPSDHALERGDDLAGLHQERNAALASMSVKEHE